MDRQQRLLRLARLRGDALAISIIEGRRCKACGALTLPGSMAVHIHIAHPTITESEMRALWGDR